jgi:hypothetical protein
MMRAGERRGTGGTTQRRRRFAADAPPPRSALAAAALARSTARRRRLAVPRGVRHGAYDAAVAPEWRPLLPAARRGGPLLHARAGAFAWLAVQFLAVLAVLLPLAWYVRGTGRTSQLRLHVDVGDAPVRIRWPRRLVGARAADDEGWGRTAWMPGDDEPWSPERDRGNPRPR